MWVSLPLAWLGLVFLVTYPPREMDWYHYGFALVVAVAFGLYARLRYRSRVLERSKDRVVIAIERRRRAE